MKPYPLRRICWGLWPRLVKPRWRNLMGSYNRVYREPFKRGTLDRLSEMANDWSDLIEEAKNWWDKECDFLLAKLQGPLYGPDRVAVMEQLRARVMELRPAEDRWLRGSESRETAVRMAFGIDWDRVKVNVTVAA